MYCPFSLPAKVKWRPVILGLVLQFILGLFVLRTFVGLVLFEWLNDVVVSFFSYSAAGVEFVFGDNYMEHYLAFAVGTMNAQREIGVQMCTPKGTNPCSYTSTHRVQICTLQFPKYLLGYVYAPLRGIGAKE